MEPVALQGAGKALHNSITLPGRTMGPGRGRVVPSHVAMIVGGRVHWFPRSCRWGVHTNHLYGPFWDFGHLLNSQLTVDYTGIWPSWS